MGWKLIFLWLTIIERQPVMEWIKGDNMKLSLFSFYLRGESMAILDMFKIAVDG